MERNISVIKDVNGNQIVIINDIRFKGWYRYDSRFAIPVFDENNDVLRYNVFHAELVIRHSENGKLYLYDVINIKKETSTPLEP